MDNLSEKVLIKLGDLNNTISESLITEMVDECIKESSEEYLAIIEKSQNSFLAKNRKIITGFEKRLFSRWKDAFNTFETLIRISIESGSFLLKNLPNEQKDNILFYVIFKLHSRGIQIANEILVLLKGGYTEGALTRWRSLHEIVVTAYYIRDGGIELANRYYDYYHIMNYNDAKTFNDNAEKLRYELIPQSEIENLEKVKLSLEIKYDKDFSKNYGWVICKGERNFKAIEKKVALEHYRSEYQNASNFVHGNVKGILYKPSILSENPLNPIISVGGTNFGLSIPGQSSAISLSQINILFLNFSVGFEKLKFINASLNYVEKCKDAFSKIDNNIVIKENVKKSK